MHENKNILFNVGGWALWKEGFLETSSKIFLILFKGHSNDRIEKLMF